MAATKLLALLTIIVLVATEIVATADSIPQDVSLNPTLEHAVYSRVKRQYIPYGYGNGGSNRPMPILSGGRGGLGYGGRGFNGGRGGLGGARGGYGGARVGFGGARGGFGGGRGRG